MDKKQKIFLSVCIASPLFLSLILYIISFSLYIEILDYRVKGYLILIWLLSSFLFLILLFIFCRGIYKQENYRLNKNKIAISIEFLLKNRFKESDFFGYFLGSLIVIYFILTTTPFIIEYYQNNLFVSFVIFLTILMLFLFLASQLRNSFVGLQENAFNRLLAIFSLGLIWIFYFSLHFYFILPQESRGNFDIVQIISTNVIWLIPALISITIPIFLFYIERKLKKKFPKREIKGWEKASPTILEELILCYFFLMHLLNISLLLILVEKDVTDAIIRALVIAIALMYFGVIYFSRSVLDKITKSFTKNMIDWSEFIECYNSQPVNNVEQYREHLIKISGKCKAVSINEKYRNKFEDFNQHFLLEIGHSKADPIDVISLEEKKPLRTTKKIIRESDEIIIIGELKSVLDDETLKYNENRISPLLLSNHIELKKMNLQHLNYFSIITHIENCNISEKQQHLKYLLEQPVMSIVSMVKSGNYELKKGIINSIKNLGNIKTEYGDLGGIISNKRDKYLVNQVVTILKNPTCKDKKSLESIRYFQEQEKANNLSLSITILVEEPGELRIIDGNKRAIALYENKKNSTTDEIILPIFFIERKKIGD